MFSCLISHIKFLLILQFDTEPLVALSLYRRLSSSSFIFLLLKVTSSMSLIRSASSSYYQTNKKKAWHLMGCRGDPHWNPSTDFSVHGMCISDFLLYGIRYCNFYFRSHWQPLEENHLCFFFFLHLEISILNLDKFFIFFIYFHWNTFSYILMQINKQKLSSTMVYVHLQVTCFSVRITLLSNWFSSPFIVTVKSIIDVFALTSGVKAGLASFVVMYSLKELITSTSLSPTFTCEISQSHIDKMNNFINHHLQFFL